jgi:hypothetical protein
MRENKNKKCPVCGYYTLDRDEPYSVCSICDWEDDPIQADDPDFWGGANDLSLNDYRNQWRKDHNVKAS